MTAARRLISVSAAVACSFALVAPVAAQAQLPPGVEAPKPTVPEIFTLMGQFVRIAYNNQGFVTLGYRMAQESVGEEWVLLEVGLTMRGSAKDVTLRRGDLSIKTPDGSVIGLATQQQYAEAGYLRALNQRTRVARDSINYFPVDATRACAIQFFANLGQPGSQLAYDQVELSSNRGCLGRLYFHVPGGIKVGQHWLNVNFGESEVQVPFRILTKEEAKQFEKSWQDIKKAHDATLK
ncbi:MAG TPA: hypothetical protein VIJ10_11505 [Vicinamibacteria bacterium]